MVQNHPKQLKIFKVILNSSNQFKWSKFLQTILCFQSCRKLFKLQIFLTKWVQTCFMLLDKYLFKNSTLALLLYVSQFLYCTVELGSFPGENLFTVKFSLPSKYDIFTLVQVPCQLATPVLTEMLQAQHFMRVCNTDRSPSTFLRIHPLQGWILIFLLNWQEKSSVETIIKLKYNFVQKIYNFL